MHLPDSALFFFYDGKEDSDNDFLLFQLLMGTHPDWMDHIDTFTEDELRMSLIRTLFEEENFDALPSFEKIIELLKDSGLSSDFCWRLTLVLQTPKMYLSQIISIMQKNIPAYEHALSVIEKPLAKLLLDFPNFQYKISSALEEDAVVTPMLIYPIAELMSNTKNAYIGIYIGDVYKMIAKSKVSRNNLLPILKAISDQSKFDILMLLKKAPSYNLELAEQLNLTPATVSHHMNVLLSHELVTIKKQDGRIYYSIQKETIENMIQELHHTF